MRGTGTSVVHCPTGPAKMGSGVTPVRRCSSAGINVSLGTDAAAANNGADLMRDLKWVALPAEAAARGSDRDDL